MLDTMLIQQGFGGVRAQSRSVAVEGCVENTQCRDCCVLYTMTGCFCICIQPRRGTHTSDGARLSSICETFYACIHSHWACMTRQRELRFSWRTSSVYIGRHGGASGVTVGVGIGAGARVWRWERALQLLDVGKKSSPPQVRPVESGLPYRD
jgi:hypothetical protein